MAVPRSNGKSGDTSLLKRQQCSALHQRLETEHAGMRAHAHELSKFSNWWTHHCGYPGGYVTLHKLTTCGREVYGCKGNRGHPYDDTFPYFDCGGGYTNLYM